MCYGYFLDSAKRSGTYGHLGSTAMKLTFCLQQILQSEICFILTHNRYGKVK